MFVQMSNKEVEQMEEAKLKARFPLAGNKPLSGHSAFLQKRLAKGVSVFCVFKIGKSTPVLVGQNAQVPATLWFSITDV